MTSPMGILIRRERLRKNLSQEGLCKGICAVSYLSKIEQGKAQAGDDILLPLTARLGIQYETDGEFLARAERAVSALYEHVLAGLEDRPGCREELAWLSGHRERCEASPHMLDVLLLLLYFRELTESPELEEFAPCMTRRQYAFYLLLRLEGALPGSGDDAEELLRLDSRAFFVCRLGILRYRQGRYMEAERLLNRGYDLAAQEGCALLMLRAKLFLGNSYSDRGQRELMLEQYQVAQRLAAALDDPRWSSAIDYNIGSTYLEWGMTEEAYAMLQALPRKGALCRHKLAIALEKLGRGEEALAQVDLARTAEVDPYDRPVIQELLDLVEYRLRHPDYLRDRAYARMMADTFALLRRTMPSGYVRFHVPYMLEVLEAERRYRDAYRLAMEFSDLPGYYRV